MRDRNIIIAILVGAMLVLAACGGISSGMDEKEKEAAAEEVAAEETAAEETAAEETAAEKTAAEETAAEETAAEETVAEETAEESNVGMANPWSETVNLEEAEAATGISFDPPAEEALPEGYVLVTYRYMDDLLEAVYEKGSEKLIVRVSKNYSGIELSGDYSEYSAEWEENFKGLVVTCKGDGILANCANADMTDMHFAVLSNVGEEGKGLTEDELKSIFMGMQAVPLEK